MTPHNTLEPAFESDEWRHLISSGAKDMGIDVSDAVGANITLYSKGREVMRALPCNNDDVNEEWLSDKGRYMVDGLSKRRLRRLKTIAAAESAGGRPLIEDEDFATKIADAEIGLTALEFLVAFLQAYVFAVLTCMYLNDALHPSH